MVCCRQTYAVPVSMDLGYIHTATSKGDFLCHSFAVVVAGDSVLVVVLWLLGIV